VPVYFLIRPCTGSDGTAEETPVTAQANQ